MIRRIDVFAVRYRHKGGPFALSGGRTSTEHDATVVRLETDEGLVGYGEQCVFTPSFLPGYGPSTRAVLELLARSVIGADPRHVDAVQARMDEAVAGYAYAKSAIDIACWDLFGKATGLRVADLLGGARQEIVSLYTAIGMAAPEEMRSRCASAREAGYRQVQVKVGSSWREDVERIEACLEGVPDADRVVVDANGYWPQADAVRVVAAVDGYDLYVEQPCGSIAECAEVRRASRRPFILDESLTGPREIVEAYSAHALDAVRLKLSRIGGITAARRARDVALALGLPLTIEDAGGGDVVTAAALHVSCSVEPRFLLAGYLMSETVEERIARGTPSADSGTARLPAGPGLGIDVDADALGAPVLRVE